MDARSEDIIYVVEEFEHEGGGRIFPHLPKVFSSFESAEDYVRERCLTYSEECLEAYECLEGGIDDPAEATFEITPVVLDSKEPVTAIDGLLTM